MINTVYFNKGCSFESVHGLYQWSYGQILAINGLESTDNISVQFSMNESGGDAVPVATNVENGTVLAKIPGFVFEKQVSVSYSAYAFVYVSTKEYGETRKVIKLYIKARPKPEDYIYTEPEKKRYELLEKRVENLENNEVEINPKNIPDMYYTEYLPENVFDETIKLNTKNRKIYTDGEAAPFELIEESKYHVLWNDAEYNCIAKSEYMSEGSTSLHSLWIGNKSLFGEGEDTGELFCYNIYYLNGKYANAVFIGTERNVDVLVKIDIYKENIKKIPPKYLPDGVPYIIDNSKELFQETELVPDGDQFIFDGIVDFVDGELYTIKWNGVDYVTKAFLTEMEGIACFLLGDYGTMMGGSGTGEPFFLVYAPDAYSGSGFTGMAMALDGSESVTMSIMGGKKEVHKLPNECLDFDWIPKTIKDETVIFEKQEIVIDGKNVFGEFYQYYFNVDKETRTKMVDEWDSLTVVLDGEKIELSYAQKDIEINNVKYFTTTPFVAGNASTFKYAIIVNKGENGNVSMLFPDSLSHTLEVSHVEITPNPMPYELLTDGTPYLIKTMSELLPEMTGDTSVNSNNEITIPFGLKLFEGDEYTVKWNGDDYNCTCYVVETEGLKVHILGDIYTYSEGDFGERATGEPFCFMIYPKEYQILLSSSGSCVPIPMVENGTYTFSIIGYDKKLRKLPEECLPDSVKELLKGKLPNINVDSELSEESTNPVQNNVITKKMNELSKEIDDLKNNVGTGGGASDIVGTYVPYINGGSFINKNDGAIYAGTNYGSTSYIPVIGGENIEIKGFYCPAGTNAGVCAYDSDFNYIGSIIDGETDSGNGKTVTLNENVAYIRITATMNGSVKVTYSDRNGTREEVEEPAYDLGTLTANCFVYKDNGSILSNTTYYGVTDYIAVTTKKLKVENPNLSGNGGICEYDENQNFISCILSPEINGGQYTVKLSSNAKYIRATIVNDNKGWLRLYPVQAEENESENAVIDAWSVATGKQIETPYKRINALAPTITFIDDDTMRYDAVKRYHDIFANFTMSEGKNLYDVSANVNGYMLLDSNGNLTQDSSYSVSDFIAVDANTQYTISTDGVVAPTWLLTMVWFYDGDKNPISKLNPKTSTFTTPLGTAYLRFTSSTTRMEGSEGNIQLEKGATATAYEKYQRGVECSVKGCYGVITDYLDRDEELKNLLLEYEEEGFGMLFHAKWQDTFYMNNENRDIVQAEKDYVQGVRRMREIGFYDFDYWVSPYGVTDDEIASMCKRHGAKCLLSTSNNTFIRNNGFDGKSKVVERYALPRCSMGYDDSQYPNFTLADLKAQIDNCVKNKGWIIITTHVQQWADTYGSIPDDRLREIIRYALNSGCEVKTFAEAYAERNSILMVNDIC